jgi:hypothetical protein
MKSKALSRRSLIAAMGGVAALLPVLQSTRPSSAQGAFPKRLIVMGKANGTRADIFWPQGGNGRDLSGMTLPALTQSLERHKSELIFLEGLEYTTWQNSGGDSHYTNLHWLTGRSGDYGGSERAYTAYGVSLDQYLLGQSGMQPLVLGVQSGQKSLAFTSFRAARQPNSIQEDPYALFETLFSAVDAPPAEMDRLRDERRSVLDVTSKGLTRIEGRVALEDRAKIQSHLEGVRSLELRLSQGASGLACSKPVTSGERLSLTSDDNIPALVALQLDLIAAALACDITRTASLYITNSGGDHTFPWLGASFIERSNHPEEGNDTRTMHNMTHFQNSDSVMRMQFIAGLTWYYEQFAGLLDRLKAVSEGDGTLLDNSLAVYFDGLSRGDEHTTNDLPFVMAGSLGGVFKTRQLVKAGSGTPHNRLLVEIAHAFGHQLSTFGDEDLSGGIPALRG